MPADIPFERLRGTTPALAKKFRRLGIATIRDLLFHLPFRYDDFSNVKSIADIALGEVATAQATLKKITATRVYRRHLSMAEAVFEDETGRLRVIWFNQPYLAKTLRVGEKLSLSGKLSPSKHGSYFANPAYERLDRHEGPVHTGGLVPVYPETTGLTSRWIRFLMKQALALAGKIPDPLPGAMERRLGLLPLAKALKQIHFPETMAEAEAARRRFAFEEIFLIQLRALRERKNLEAKRAPAIPVDIELIKKFVSSLPFPLTGAQKKAAWEIVNDMAKPRPMNRLLEGDVGSGKTIVAALISLNAVSRGYQVAYLAPTEILALQHFHTFKRLLLPFGVSVGLLTASQKKIAAPFGESDKADMVKLASSGEAGIVIGTHAVIQDKVQFKHLGIAIIDEQHRFGVKQRAHLLKKEKGSQNAPENLMPHFLSMTATPIPRTLALTVYGDLDISVIDEAPAGRKPVITKIVPSEKRHAAYEFIRGEVKKSGQVFVICPRIEIAGHEGKIHTPRELIGEEVKTVKAEREKLSREIFPDLKVEMLHGRMKPAEKEKVMRAFKDREFDILVSTSVVEVGVDIPNASVMLIEGAEKFGLAQIHQFRGRVGRGEHQAYCLLMTSSALAAESARLKAVVYAKNGFQLAEKDLAIRGPGDFLGTRQSGIPPFAYKSFADIKIVQTARAEAAALIEKDPSLKSAPALSARLEIFEAAVHFE